VPCALAEHADEAHGVSLAFDTCHHKEEHMRFVCALLVGLFAAPAFAKAGTPAQYYRTAMLPNGLQGGSNALKVRTIQPWTKGANGRLEGVVKITSIQGVISTAGVQLIGAPDKRVLWQAGPGGQVGPVRTVTVKTTATPPNRAP
jgi:hypothetical protein